MTTTITMEENGTTVTWLLCSPFATIYMGRIEYVISNFYEKVLAWFIHQTMQQELVEHNHASYTETPKLFVLFQGYRHHNEKIIKVNSYCQHLTPLYIYNMHQNPFFFNYTENKEITNNESQLFH